MVRKVDQIKALLRQSKLRIHLKKLDKNLGFAVANNISARLARGKYLALLNVAAFLRVKLKHLDEWNMRRSKVASTYLNSLSGLPDLILPSVSDSTEPIWHIFPIRHSKRDDLQKYLKNKGVDTLIHYPVPPHLSGAYADLSMPKGTFPIAEKIASSELSLPMGPHLSLDDVEYITSIIREFVYQA